MTVNSASGTVAVLIRQFMQTRTMLAGIIVRQLATARLAPVRCFPQARAEQRISRMNPSSKAVPMFLVRLLAAMLAVAPLALAIARAQDQAILGVWWTEDNKGRVEISNCSDPKQGLCGKIIWLSQPNDAEGRPQTDKKNKDPSLRNRQVLGLAIFEGWRPAGNNAWKGEVYDPEDGEAYEVDITLAGDELTLRGCVLLVCDSDTWRRYRG
jgi:uncharacterized protein (DUF2147 family)